MSLIVHSFRVPSFNFQCTMEPVYCKRHTIKIHATDAVVDDTCIDLMYDSWFDYYIYC